MHELSIAQNILEIVHDHVPPPQRPDVRSVRLKIGEVAGVVIESLEFCFTAITAGTPLAHAALRVERVPFRLHCRTCGTVSADQQGGALCPACGGIDTTVLGGTELQIISIELCDEAT